MHNNQNIRRSLPMVNVLRDIKSVVNYEYTIFIEYTDQTSRYIPYVQYLYECEIGRELMPHEFVSQIDNNLDNFKIDNLRLYVMHPDWPEVQQDPLIALRPKEFKRVCRPSLAKRDGRFYVEIVYFDGKRRTCSYARFLMEQSLKRELTSYEHVDHIDENKTNDIIQNLQILSDKKNTTKNAIHRGLNTGENIYSEYKCLECKKLFKRLTCYVKDEQKTFCSRKCVTDNRIKIYFLETGLEKYKQLTCCKCGNIFTRLRYDYDKSVRKKIKNFFCSNSCRYM